MSGTGLARTGQGVCRWRQHLAAGGKCRELLSRRWSECQRESSPSSMAMSEALFYRPLIYVHHNSSRLNDLDVKAVHQNGEEAVGQQV